MGESTQRLSRDAIVLLAAFCAFSAAILVAAFLAIRQWWGAS